MMTAIDMLLGLDIPQAITEPARPRTRSGGSGRRPRAKSTATRPAPDPLGPIRRLALAGSLAEAEELWVAICSRIEDLRRAAKRQDLGRQAMALASDIDANPALKTNQANRLKGRVLDVLASIAAGDARGIRAKQGAAAP